MKSRVGSREIRMKQGVGARHGQGTEFLERLLELPEDLLLNGSWEGRHLA